jgi:hypothetical protein
MDIKVEAFRNYLATIIPNSTVRHKITKDIKHEFTINMNVPPHCHRLFVQRVFIEDKTEQDMIESFTLCNAPNIFQDSGISLRLYLSNEGLEPVDEHFS